MHRAWTLASGWLRYADALYVAAAERHGTALLTADTRIERSGAPITCEIITVAPATVPDPPPAGHVHDPSAAAMTLHRTGKLRAGPYCLTDQVTLAGGGDPATPAGS